MKKLLIILGFIAALLAVILAVTPLFKIAIAPAILSFICGLALYFVSKKDEKKPKAIQFIFLLTIISISFIVYKSIFSKTEVLNTEEIQKRDNESEEDAIELLEDIEIDN